MRGTYINNCVGWPRRYVRDLCDLCDGAINISRRTFTRHVDLDELHRIERDLGYGPAGHGLTMPQDYHVQYKRGKLLGHRVYFFVWSGIEYVFGPDSIRGRLQ